jgi:C4-type Zn-finger protein
MEVKNLLTKCMSNVIKDKAETYIEVDNKSIGNTIIKTVVSEITPALFVEIIDFIGHSSIIQRKIDERNKRYENYERNKQVMSKFRYDYNKLNK